MLNFAPSKKQKPDKNSLKDRAGNRGLGKDMALSLARKVIDVLLTYNRKREDALAVVAEIEQTGR